MKFILTPFVAFERGCETLSVWLKNWALLDVLDRLSRLAVLVAVGTWLYEIPGRADLIHATKVANAWSILNSGQGKGASGGRESALATLISEHQSLNGIDLSKSYFKSLDLNSQRLDRANLSYAYFEDGNFERTTLMRANLFHAEFVDISFEGAFLYQVECDSAFFNGDISFRNTDFKEAFCPRAEFNGTVEGADFTAADLREANFLEVRDWNLVRSYQYANLYGVQATPDFLTWALAQGAVQIENSDEWLDYLESQKYMTYWLERRYRRK